MFVANPRGCQTQPVLRLCVLLAFFAVAVALGTTSPAGNAAAGPPRIVEYSLELELPGPEPSVLEIYLYAIDDGTVPMETRKAQGRAAMLARFPGALERDPGRAAAAFKLFSTPVRWPSPSASWLYNPTGATPAMPPASSLEAIRAGAAGWDNAGGSGFHFDFLGSTTTATGCNGDTTSYQRDGLNVVGWGHIVGGHLGFSCHWRSASLVEGTPFFAIQEIDIVFEPQFAYSAHSLQALALHEFGHALGLDHTEPPACPGKAMCGGANAMLFTEPQQDDIFGVIALYGVAPTPTIPPPEQRPFRAIAPGVGRDSGG
jgi:hypothetical protein